MGSESYKQAHEAFMSNLKGTSVECVSSCIFQLPLFIFLVKVLQEQKGNKPKMTTDVIVVVLPLLLVSTICSDFNGYIFWFMFILVSIIQSWRNGANVLLTCIAILAVDFRVFPRSFGKTETYGVSLMDAGVGSFIISSAITSRHARGLSNKNSTPSTLDTVTNTANANNDTRSLSNHFFVLINCLPWQKLMVLGLGVGRMVALKALNYQEHVSEYGVHWNFFATLFFVWTAADSVHNLLGNRRRSLIALCAVAALCGYQYLLVATPLTEYVFYAPRDNLFSANKEGVVSLLGYIPLYLLTEELSHWLFFSPKTPSIGGVGNANDTAVCAKSTATVSAKTIVEPIDSVTCSENALARLQSSGSDLDVDGVPSHVTIETMSSAITMNSDANGSHSSVSWDKPLIFRLSICCVVLWVTWVVSATVVQPTSRRLVNLSYVALTLVLSFSMVLSLLVVDTLTAGAKSPVLTLTYMSRHSLAVFLGGNLMTGAVNSSMQTIHASDAVAMSVLIVYCVMLTALAWGCEFVRTRRWGAKESK